MISTFQSFIPDIVRSLLVGGEQRGVAEAIRETLWLSVCGGSRSFTDHNLDPQYHYILEQGEALANRFSDDAVLGKFYRMVADSERHHLQRQKEVYGEQDELE